MFDEYRHIAIVGLGLIGGCIARTARKLNPDITITGFGRNRERMAKAHDMGLIDAYHVGFEHGLEEAELDPINTYFFLASEALGIVKIKKAISKKRLIRFFISYSSLKSAFWSMAILETPHFCKIQFTSWLCSFNFFNAKIPSPLY